MMTCMTSPTRRRYTASDLIRGAAARDRLPQGDLADSLGMSRQALSARITGRTGWTLSELRTVAQLLGLDFYELVDASLPEGDGGEVA